MKNYVLLTFALLVSLNVFSQDEKKRLKTINSAPIVYLGDTLYHNGKIYCVMKEIKTGDPNHPDYRISSVKGEQLFSINYIVPTGIGSFGSYRIKFASGNEVKIKTKEEKELPGIIISNDLVSNGMTVPKDKEELFITSNGGSVQTGDGGEDKFKMVTRNRKANVIVLNESITQDTNKVGYFKESGTYINKVFVKVVVFYLPNGQKIAEANYAEKDADSATVMTIKDGKSMTINLVPSKKLS